MPTRYETTARSRFHPTPTGRRVLLTERDLAMFRLLGRYRYLPANFLLAFAGGHATYHRARLTDLFHEGFLDKPSSQWDLFNARYRFDTYELGRRGKLVLEEMNQVEGFQVGTGGAFRHEQLVCALMASIELACRGRYTLLSWKDVLLRSSAAVRNERAPFAVPTNLEHVGVTVPRVLRPDALPFGIAGKRTFWFLGMELDRHTEPLHPADLTSKRSSILQKIVQYQHVVETRLFETRFGLPNVLVPFVTVNDRHMHNMVELVLSLTGGKGVKWMLFKSLPEIASRELPLAPLDDILTASWLRPGNTPLSLAEELDRNV